MSYQWQFNDVDLPGASSSVLSFPQVHTSQAGDYRVVVTNSFGSVTSQVAHLAVFLAPPVVLVPPQNLTVPAGGNASLSAIVGGSPPFTYQWVFNGTNLPAATNSTLLLTNLQSTATGDYWVIVANVAGSATSAPPAQVTVVPLWCANAEFKPGAGFKLTFQGQTGLVGEVLASTSLVDWLVLGRFTNATGVVDFTDPDQNHNRRFYRARLLP